MSEDDGYPSGEDGRVLALEARAASSSGGLQSPSVARNKDVLRDAFYALVPDARRVLEIASGTGEHAVHIAAARPDIRWTTSDPDPASRESIAAWIAARGEGRVEGPLSIDATAADWGVLGPFDALVAINMIHIAPIAACEGVFAGAAQLLRPAGRIFFYGPFSRNGVHSAPSNEEFDASLNRRDAAWGVRDLELDLGPIAAAQGFQLTDVRDMPANNLSVIFART
ncbi:MAG: DUF938 domain-containing protein [Pseudomonadota bacterium]